jgi:DNA-binding transcriptional regulator PaaX
MKRKIDKKLLTKKLLTYLLLAGGLGIFSILAPQLPYNILKSYLKQKELDRKKFKRKLERLNKQGLVDYQEQKDGFLIHLTEKGKIRAKKYHLEELKLQKPKKWDGLWRIVIFDIPNRFKLARDVLRQKLKELKFTQLQESVFIHPYPCETEIKLLREVYKIRPFVKIIIAKSIENSDKYLEKYFKG